jgi:hypothetical protein
LSILDKLAFLPRNQARILLMAVVHHKSIILFHQKDS